MFIYLENLNAIEGKCGIFVFAKQNIFLLLFFLCFYFFFKN